MAKNGHMTFIPLYDGFCSVSGDKSNARRHKNCCINTAAMKICTVKNIFGVNQKSPETVFKKVMVWYFHISFGLRIPKIYLQNFVVKSIYFCK